jgi:hypothetical protein
LVELLLISPSIATVRLAKNKFRKDASQVGVSSTKPIGFRHILPTWPKNPPQSGQDKKP